MSRPSVSPQLRVGASAEEVRAHFLHHCVASRALDKAESKEGGLLCEAFKAFMVDLATDAIKAHAEHPILISYQSDATSYLSQSVVTASSGGAGVLRKGKALVEYLMERGIVFVSVLRRQEVEAFVLPGEPRLLRSGKKSGNLFQAASVFFRWPGCWNTRGWRYTILGKTG